ncbi:hypothetical protein [Thermococcus sp.]|uniref:hypothetical protein n=1 Tax=Thermococcus sp. TaxID=35749 RepID=UPI00262CD727|nr:hypothetical protein [Thermococcus sp.]
MNESFIKNFLSAVFSILLFWLVYLYEKPRRGHIGAKITGAIVFIAVTLLLSGTGFLAWEYAKVGMLAALLIMTAELVWAGYLKSKVKRKAL